MTAMAPDLNSFTIWLGQNGQGWSTPPATAVELTATYRPLYGQAEVRRLKGNKRSGVKKGFGGELRTGSRACDLALNERLVTILTPGLAVKETFAQTERPRSQESNHSPGGT